MMVLYMGGPYNFQCVKLRGEREDPSIVTPRMGSVDWNEAYRNNRLALEGG